MHALTTLGVKLVININAVKSIIVKISFILLDILILSNAFFNISIIYATCNP